MPPDLYLTVHVKLTICQSFPVNCKCLKWPWYHPQAWTRVSVKFLKKNKKRYTEIPKALDLYFMSNQETLTWKFDNAKIVIDAPPQHPSDQPFPTHTLAKLGGVPSQRKCYTKYERNQSWGYRDMSNQKPIWQWDGRTNGNIKTIFLHILYMASTHKPPSNTVHYKIVSDTTPFKDRPQRWTYTVQKIIMDGRFSI